MIFKLIPRALPDRVEHFLQSVFMMQQSDVLSFKMQCVPLQSSSTKLSAAKKVGLPKQVITLANGQVEFPCDDHHEFAEISLVYLSALKSEVTFRRSGALRNA